MRAKHFLVILCSVIIITIILMIFGQQKPATIQTIMSSTHQQLRNFKDTLRDAGMKTLVANKKYLIFLGFTDNPRLYPENVWTNSSLPVIVTYVMEGQESQAVGLINNVARILPNNTILVYDLGLGNYGLRLLLNYCNSSRCQVVTFNLNEFPAHVQRDLSHAYRPLIIQDALQRTGAIFFLECHYRFSKQITSDTVIMLYENTVQKSGVLAWKLPTKNAVSSLTHKKMFEYFHTEADNFLFLPMVSSSILLLINIESVHKEIMLPWIQCSLTQDCIIPIGAQSEGCRFNKKPQYRYSGCHSYDTSALNIVLGVKFKLEGSRYMYDDSKKLFDEITLDQAVATLKSLEQNLTTEGRIQSIDMLNF